MARGLSAQLCEVVTKGCPNDMQKEDRLTVQPKGSLQGVRMTKGF